MANSSEATTKPVPVKPEYLTVPTPAPNGKDPASEFLTSAPVRRRPVGSKDPSDVLIEAAERLLRAAAARIAYHEQHAQRLREAMAGFSKLARHSVAHDLPSSGGPDVVQAFLDLAREHFPEDEQS